MYQTVQRLIRERIPAKRLWWLRLDHPLLLDIDLGSLVRWVIDASGATANRPAFLFLDEVTYADKWDLWLKTFYDEDWPVRIVGTSSATAAIRERGLESGVGRWNELFLAPYLFTEYLSLHGEKICLPCDDSLAETIRGAMADPAKAQDRSDERRRYILTGGFPELLLKSSALDEDEMILTSQRVLRQDAIQKAIYQDIPQAFDIQDPQRLERLLYCLAGQITGILSPTSIQSDIGLNATTIERHVSYLERTFLIFTVPNYSPSEGTVQRRGRKLYFIDSAVRNAALLRGIAPLRNMPEMGMLIENAAAGHLHSLSLQSGVRLYHWRQRRAEVDLIYDHPRSPIAFEVTSGDDHHTKGLHALQDAHPKFRGRCYLVGPSFLPRVPTQESPGSIPLDMFLMAIGCQAAHAMEYRVNVAARAPDPQKLLFP